MKKKHLRIYLIFFIFVFVLLKTHYKFTDGFRVNKVLLYPEDKNVNWDISFSEAEKRNVFENVLNQKFYYLSKGRQSYVFSSEDEKYVIKFLRYHKYHMPLFCKYLQKIKIVPKNMTRMLFEKRQRIKRAMDSYLIAYKDLKDQTQVNYLHLNKTSSINKYLLIQDGSKRNLKINLDDVGFVIQKKAHPLDKYLKGLARKNDDEKLKNAILYFFDMAKFRYSRSIVNRDVANSVRNSSFLDNRIIEIDVGSFYYKKFLDEMDFEKQINEFTQPLLILAKDHFPHLMDFITMRLEEIKKEYKKGREKSLPIESIY
jgi:hypothetical protein